MTSAQTSGPSPAGEKDLRRNPQLREATESRELDLADRRQGRRFRTVMLWALPVVALSWLVLIVLAIFTDRIEGVQVGLALGGTGAGLLTLLGRQIWWSHPPGSAKPARARGDSQIPIPEAVRDWWREISGGR